MSRYRSRVPKGKSRRIFRRSSGSRKINYKTSGVARGGIRL